MRLVGHPAAQAVDRAQPAVELEDQGLVAVRTACASDATVLPHRLDHDADVRAAGSEVGHVAAGAARHLTTAALAGAVAAARHAAGVRGAEHPAGQVGIPRLGELRRHRRHPERRRNLVMVGPRGVRDHQTLPAEPQPLVCQRRRVSDEQQGLGCRHQMEQGERLHSHQGLPDGRSSSCSSDAPAPNQPCARA